MTASSIVHSSFVVEHTYPASAARVFAAFSNPATKRRWFAEGEGWQIDEFNVDFRVGGRETSRFRRRRPAQAARGGLRRAVRQAA
jgi:uncharacterized protein YndB with AHSA1/START domain